MDIRARAMEDFGKAPNCSGSIIFNTAGPMNADTTKSSANLEIIGVREMGRKCFAIDLAHRGVRQEHRQMTMKCAYSSVELQCSVPRAHD